MFKKYISMNMATEWTKQSGWLSHPVRIFGDDQTTVQTLISWNFDNETAITQP